MKYSESFQKKVFVILVSFFVICFKGIAQDSTRIISKDQYLIPLNIPENWEIKRQWEGGDLTLSAYSPDNKAFIYYCQFMNDNKVRPKTYFKTYTRQFEMDGKAETIGKNINTRREKLFYSIGEGILLDEKYNIIFFASNVKRKNIIAYLVYPLQDQSVDKEWYKSIMLYK